MSTTAYELTDADPPVIRELAKFPTLRRVPVINFDVRDRLTKGHTHIQEGMPFILRPKKGKSILKTLGVACL